MERTGDTNGPGGLENDHLAPFATQIEVGSGAAIGVSLAGTNSLDTMDPAIAVGERLALRERTKHSPPLKGARHFHTEAKRAALDSLAFN